MNINLSLKSATLALKITILNKYIFILLNLVGRLLNTQALHLLQIYKYRLD